MYNGSPGVSVTSFRTAFSLHELYIIYCHHSWFREVRRSISSKLYINISPFDWDLTFHPLISLNPGAIFDEPELESAVGVDIYCQLCGGTPFHVVVK